MNYQKYSALKPVHLTDRTWPDQQITQAPLWCSVDLRDGNQALERPMTLEEKLTFFELLVKIGFKEIEIGFPAASDTEFLFTRTLIEKELIPEDVIVQVLVQSRKHIIERTFEALEGVPKAIIHLYNSTSTLQREVVFQAGQEAIKDIAVNGAKFIQQVSQKYGEERFLFEYSPESFTGTELEYAAEICNGVLEVWEPCPERKVIINLPSTVELGTPNIYADQIEYMRRNLRDRENVILSVHTHNDRGTAVASTELALMAGADRVEGTLFGNGERTGNADLLNLAMNLYSQGIDPKLDFSHIDDLVEVYEKFTGLYVHPRHPYAGSLVYTAFSGSHQDAIHKGMAKLSERAGRWEVPYLPIDPVDVGRNYEAVIRINSQSGKGGVAFVLEKSYGLQIPKKMRQNFGQIVTEVSDKFNKELLPGELYELFQKTYVNIADPLEFIGYREETNGQISVQAVIKINGVKKEIAGHGGGLIEAFCNGLIQELNTPFEIMYYTEHSLEYGSKSQAITYTEIADLKERLYFGAGVSGSITKSSLKAIVSAVNHMLS